jgi:hypothetical protein
LDFAFAFAGVSASPASRMKLAGFGRNESGSGSNNKQHQYKFYVMQERNQPTLNFFVVYRLGGQPYKFLDLILQATFKSLRLF